MGAVGDTAPLVRGCAVRRGAGRRAVSAVHVVVGALYCGVTYLLGAKKASFGRVRPLPCHEIHQWCGTVGSRLCLPCLSVLVTWLCSRLLVLANSEPQSMLMRATLPCRLPVVCD